MLLTYMFDKDKIKTKEYIKVAVRIRSLDLFNKLPLK